MRNVLCGAHVCPSVSDTILPSSVFVRDFQKVPKKGPLYKKLSSNGKFLKNLCSDRHSLPKSVKEFLPLISIFIGRFS